MRTEPKSHPFTLVSGEHVQQLCETLERTLRRLAGNKRVGFMLLLFEPEEQAQDWRPDLGDVTQVLTASNLADEDEEAKLLRMALSGLKTN